MSNPPQNRLPRLAKSLIALFVPWILLTGCSGPEHGWHRARRTGDLSQGKVARAPFDAHLTGACGPGGLTPTGGEALSRTPYLQQVTANSAAIMWTSSHDEPFTVKIAKPGAGSASAVAEPEAGGPGQFIARLDALEPDTLYCYQLHSAAGPLTELTGFRTFPLPGTSRPLRFAVIGDSGERSIDQDAVVEVMRTVPLDLVVNTGDLGGDEGKLSEYEETFFQPYAGLLDRIPHLVTIGNHECKTNQGEPFRQVFALPENGGEHGRELWYSYDWGDVHFVSLNTNVINAEQVRWLEEDLARNQLPWTIVLMHHPPFSSGMHGNNPKVLAAFGPALQAHNVPLVLVGHDHHYERTKALNGVTYLVTGGAGRGTRGVGKSHFTAFAERVAHLVYVTIEGEELRLWAIDATGQEFDSALIRRPSR